MLRRIACLVVFAGAVAIARDAPAPIRVAPEPEPEPARPAVVEILRTVVQGDRLQVEARLPEIAGARPELVVDGKALDAAPTAASGDVAFSVPVTPDGQEHRIAVRVGALSAEARVVYPPPPPTPLMPWLIGLAGLAAIVGAALATVLVRRRGRVRLSVISGPEAGLRLVLRSGKTRIGSLADNDLVLSSPTVSRFHAEILLGGGSAELRDLHSLNGTQLNGRRIEVAKLSPGDKLKIGDVDLFFEG